jgi:dihydroxyacetone kinase-like predicted kinase
VVLLPNNGNVIMSARQVLHLTKKQVRVIPSDSMPQGISALLAFNFEADLEENRRAMEDAIKRVDTVEVTQAVRSVQLEGINVREGDIIGLVNGRLVTAGTDMLDVAQRALGRMGAGSHELFTVYYGEGVDRPAAEALAQRIKGWFPSGSPASRSRWWTAGSPTTPTSSRRSREGRPRDGARSVGAACSKYSREAWGTAWQYEWS